jgi:hypothetical protein
LGSWLRRSRLNATIDPTTASDEQLERCLEKILSAQTLEELLHP